MLISADPRYFPHQIKYNKSEQNKTKLNKTEWM